MADEQTDLVEEDSERDWRDLLLMKALDRLGQRVNTKNVQIFDLCVTKGLPVADVARRLHVTRARVYLARERIGRLLKREIEQLRQKLDGIDKHA